MKRVFIDMDNVLVDFQSGLDQVSEEIKVQDVWTRYQAYLER